MDTTRSYYEIVQVDIENAEYDFIKTKLNLLPSYINREPTYVNFTTTYVGRLDLLSYDYYQTPKLWWVIAEVNNLDNPFSAELVDTLIRIPDILDIYDFYRDNFVDDSAFL